ncbi:acyl-CoA N-acyltransferase [Cucurbitaria berberidis CBS 394.84]|uniref:Acyl-CoA N-acyltransferase n=1 Tax=Cucurbitaria berberidis CBS 394.84 TaxID=1168544 RepID=A0A9P4GSG8_9PLEO|nr:acyl-CoA N-acyltransferase [Cucurbitaria berberidis CBS 394.84]KAF1850651.1 acyl-CoA N-acyltransferase [Cucurbitaria berberidis CBS 394.84]
MPIRLATPSDEPAIVSACTAAFFDEALFGRVIHPHRHEYPEDVEIFWHEQIRHSWREPNNKILVAITIEKGEEKVVGVAVWQRQGDDEGRKKVEAEWVDVGPDAFRPLPSTVNRAIDPNKRTILEDSYPYYSHHWSPSKNSIPRSRNWYLSLCCVHPSYEHRGLGRELVHWGLERAREEGVHASVLASHNNDPFYLRCGFDEIVADCTEGEENPLQGVEGGSLLFMWAKGQDKG